jgi:hypothetical protein
MGEHSVGTPQQWLADAFGITFSVAVALIAVALMPALLLPRTRRGHEATAAPGTERSAAA